MNQQGLEIDLKGPKVVFLIFASKFLAEFWGIPPIYRKKSAK